MMQKIKVFFKNNWLLFFLIVIGTIIPLHWFSDGRIIAGGDQFLYYHPTNVFFDYFYTWLERMNLGEPNPGIQLLFPFLFFFKCFELIGFSPLVTEIIWAGSLFLLSGFFMYILVCYLTENQGVWGKAAALAAAIFYMFNPYVMMDPVQIGVRPIQTVLPLIVFIWIKALESQKNDLKYSILFAFSTLFISSSTTNPAYTAAIIIAISFYTLYFICSCRSAFWKTLSFLLKTLFITIMFHLWWIVPSLFSYLESVAGINKFLASYNFLKSTKIWEAFRLMGFWASRIKHPFGMDHVPFVHFFYEFPFLFISYLVPVIALSGLVVKSRSKKLIYFVFLFLIAVFLTKGSNPPFGFIYQYFYDKFPFFNLFREPYSKFTPLTLFALAVMFGLSLSSIVNNIKYRWRLPIILFFLGTSILGGFPIITGQSFQDPSWHNMTLDSMHVEIPNYWFEAGKWLRENDPNSRILLFPKSGYGVCYNWEMGTCSGEPVARMLLPNQIVKYPGPEVHYRDEVLNGFYDSALSGELKDFGKALGLAGIKYVLQQNDLNWQYGLKDTFPPEKMASLLQAQRSLRLVKTIGKLDIYSLDSDVIYPWIYVTSNLDYVVGEANNLGKLIDSEEIQFPKTFFLGSRENIDNFSRLNVFPSIGEIPPKVFFERLNSTRFKVTIKGAQNPYFLVFISSFSKYWKLRFWPDEKKDLLSFLNKKEKYLPENYHFIANGFANGWYIKPADFNYKSDYQLVIDYLPQKYFIIASYVSAGSIILSLFCLFLFANTTGHFGPWMKRTKSNLPKAKPEDTTSHEVGRGSSLLKALRK